ncbi:GGDEF domain-containing protein [Kineococcus xinjiangensis]|uniref:GGDEF domain-containing protein n=1 Tax=Kineococcus xinjiangensis TaxID=512762 RepID=UPI0011B05548|nr:GGDEF domain-containing protein [Kineococcus xinjiangensis]
MSSFGPFDVLAERAHGFYLDGFSESAVQAAREGLAFCEAAGDERTARFLQFICGVALHQLGRHSEASVEAGHLLRRLESSGDPLWRAKALALLAEARVDLGMTTLAMDHLAEGRMLVAAAKGGGYNRLAATMSVALALRALVLFEPADELLVSISSVTRYSRRLQLTVVQEAAVLRASWGAMLELVGRPGDAREHYGEAHARALWMQQLAWEVGYPEMLARGEAIEGFVLQRTGAGGLAEARLRQAMAGFRQREVLAETHIARIGLALALSERGLHTEARALLEEVTRTIRRSHVDVWASAALSAIARVAVEEHGDHPVAAPLSALVRSSLSRLWADREGRFEALQDRMRVREMAEQTDRMGRAALEDPLTRLGNRRLLQQVLERADRLFGAIFVDVDSFKFVNDDFSHEVGDAVLRRVAEVLRSRCRDEDVVIRYGGDEFVLLLAGEDADARSVAERVLAGVRAEDWEALAPGLRVTVSLGVARRAPAAEALSQADAACAAAKRGGRDRVAGAPAAEGAP